MIKNYNITLEKEIKDVAMSNLGIGQKLSPLINEFLKLWILNPKLLDQERDRQQKPQEAF